MDSIIVVEDEQLILELVVDVLEMYGYKVRPFHDADEAWCFIRDCNYPPRLLITDLNMPGKIDGVELIRRVLDVQPQMPVIVASGFHSASEDIADQSVFWLPKPFNIDQLHSICIKLAPLH
ncbi:response regulator [Pseudomonas sp. LP_7_YM]|uniref:response regulator n=1 Tax=Pseudomonas sp. LP_7_YM TaxID=2485137 RepID=UPI00105C8ABA|nr:response regulator [Pseudomonas sp. LP_7_YM]TDV62611.1 response regulator receiver domain-containing protein [Pseudomonas sp. LP_7_YM]